MAASAMGEAGRWLVKGWQDLEYKVEFASCLSRIK